MKRIGYFRDMLGGNATDMSVYSFEQNNTPIDFDTVAAYLNNGQLVAAYSEIVRDPLCSDSQIIGYFHIYTDGEWEWTSYYWYYIKKYNLKVPNELLQKINILGIK